MQITYRAKANQSMKIKRKVKLYGDYAKVKIIHPDYTVIFRVDTEDLCKIQNASLTNGGHVQCSAGLVHRIVMGCEQYDGVYVDHKDGNKLNNRKYNLRKTTNSGNMRNMHNNPRNNTGTIGVQLRTNGAYEYYRVSWRDEEGRRKTKQFNVNKLGDENAYKDACAFLEKRHKEFGYL